MTEHQWLTSTDPHAMLRAIDPTLTKVWKKGDPEPWRVWSGRKGRLFACACCMLRGTPLAVVEDYEKAGMFDDDEGDYVGDLAWARHWTEEGMNNPTLEIRANLLRDIFGNPWQPINPLYHTLKGKVRYSDSGCTLLGTDPDVVFPISPWLTWRDGLILTMAQDIYDNRRFDELPILADALEEAGCQEQAILDHLRSSCPYCKDAYFGTGDGNIPTGKGLNDPVQQATYKRRFAEYYNKQCVCKGTRLAIHVRGCWLVDLLLGKE